MKKLFKLFFILVSLQFFAQETLIANDYYSIVYSQEKRQPLTVNYQVYCNDNCVVKRASNFHLQKGVKTAKDGDFKGYDRGHMIPFESVCCNAKLAYESFSYINVSVQNSFLNRGVWKTLEEVERRLAKNATVNVQIVVDFDEDKPKKTSTGVWIPRGFYKSIWVNDKKIRDYYFPNEKPISPNLKNYEIKLEEAHD